jgi:hypothetical protein
VGHTFYATTGVLRTIELVLGLEPMSEYDAAATPMYNAFQPTPNLSADLTPEQPLNEIIWRSVKGDQPMPPPRRSVLVRPRN